MRILLIEDDAMIGESLSRGLKKQGYAIDWVREAEAGEISLRSESYDLLLLDIGLPGKSGISVLKALRARGDSTRVLIITARDDVSDRVLGLDSGADDYLVKPFALEELEARIRALLRRRDGRASPLMMAGAITLDPATKEISYNQKTLILSAREFALMSALMEKPGAVLSIAQLEERLYGWNQEVGSNAVEVHIHQLRKKLGNDIIRNMRGVGYMVQK